MRCYWCQGETTNITLENGNVVEVRPCNNCNQPERSKREDCFSNFKKLGHEMFTIPLSDECWCIKCEQPNFVIKEKQMRCSEHDSNAVREVQ